VRIASWNVNSIRARIDHVHRFLKEANPDVVCLQETKVTDADFPTDTFARAGYETHRTGEKSYNGVAIISRHPVSDVRIGLHDGTDADDRRLIAGTIAGLRVFSAYVPNGKSLDSPAYQEKLKWLARLTATMQAEGAPTRPIALCGDFNVARDDRDVYDPARWQGVLHVSPPERQSLVHLMETGLHDAFRESCDEAGHYSWWDYRAGSFQRDRGLRIDYVWLSTSARQKLVRAYIERAPRGWEKPSDHTPVVADLDWSP
jgi:exodeoxyribonuclease III